VPNSRLLQKLGYRDWRNCTQSEVLAMSFYFSIYYRRMLNFYKYFYDIVLDELLSKRTVDIEVFLATVALACGWWVATPSFRTFGPATLLYHVPELLTGTVIFVYGCIAAWAVFSQIRRCPRSPRNLQLCCWSAFGGAVLWSTVLATFAVRPPRTLMIIPILACIVVAYLWVYYRLRLRFTP
jgi:hypothetical protein